MDGLLFSQFSSLFESLIDYQEIYFHSPKTCFIGLIRHQFCVKKLSPIPKSNHFIFNKHYLLNFNCFPNSFFCFVLEKKNKTKEKSQTVEYNLDLYSQDELGAFAILAACTIQTKPTRRETVCSLLISLYRK